MPPVPSSSCSSNRARPRGLRGLETARCANGSEVAMGLTTYNSSGAISGKFSGSGENWHRWHRATLRQRPYNRRFVIRLLLVFGTRPEAIKLAPLIRALLARSRDFEARVCVTAQHRDMLDPVLAAFQIAPDYDLDLMRPGQTPAELTARILEALDPVLRRESPRMVLVQGDTTTTLAAALAAFYLRIPVGHVEAGLRTGDLRQPFPEEMNRVVTSRLADLHFAPTAGAAAHLAAEGVPAGRIHVTGNTGIDAVLYVRDSLESGALPATDWPWLDPRRRLILVTGHRRENF